MPATCSLSIAGTYLPAPDRLAQTFKSIITFPVAPTVSVALVAPSLVAPDLRFSPDNQIVREVLHGALNGASQYY